jgi:hypothetical protein
MDEFDIRGDLIIDEGSQVPEASSLLVSISHSNQQDEDSSLLGDANFGLNMNDRAQNSKSQFDILPLSSQLQ